MLSTALFSDLVGRIYECALDPGQWPETLSCLRRRLGFCNAALNLIDLRSGMYLLHIIRDIDEPWRSRMHHYGPAVIEQWGGAQALQEHPIDEPAVLSRLNPQGMAASRYGKEWAEPQGIVDVMALVLSRDEQAVGAIGLGRHRDMGPIGSAEVDAARLLLPHLQRTIAISRLLDLKSAEAASFETVVDDLAVGVFLVNEEAVLIHANRAGETMLAEGSLLRLRGKRLRPCSLGGQRALDAALRDIAVYPDQIARRGFNVPLSSNAGRPAGLHVLPISPRTQRLGMLAGASAAVFVSPAPRGRCGSPELVPALFDLTPAEGRVLDLLVQGYDIPHIARSLGIGASTVRTHLLRLYEKTGVRRQAALVALVSSLELPLRA